VSRPLLTIDGIQAGYGDIVILHGVSLTVAEGSVTALLGSNGAGKTTLMRVVAGLITPRAGAISFDGRDLTRVPASDRVEWGVSLVPEGRLIFADFTVEENLFVGASAPRPRAERDRTLRQVFDMFPILSERRRQKGRTLSGGEQQMLAIGRALMARPRLLLLDEPSLGLAPKVMTQLFETVQAIRRAGLTVLIVEQNVQTTLSIADRAYVLENGRLAMEGTGSSLLSDPRIKRAYLGL
jgi:branched-chain amino acid transport system ATP-binding protein